MLPVEVWFIIYGYCSIVDYLNLRHTCHQNKDIITHLVKSEIKASFNTQLYFDSQFCDKTPTYKNVVRCLSHINIVAPTKSLSFTIDKNFLLKVENWSSLNCLIRIKMTLLWFIEMINFISMRIASKHLQI